MSMNRLDSIYRNIVLTKYFVKGWGKSENIKRFLELRKIVSDREECYKLIPPDYPVTTEKAIDCSDYYLINGHFVSPIFQFIPDAVPEECRKAYFQIVLPKTWKHDHFKPIVLHIAGTGDHFFWRRRTLLAKPLIKEGNIGSLILENPFYGHRKPKDQKRSILNNVSDIFVMGGSLILESLVMFHYCEQQGYGPLGITGISMGGHNASLSATNWPKPLVIVPCLSGLTASGVFTQNASLSATNWPKPLVIVPCLSGLTASGCFTQGAISGAIDWKLLEEQFHSDMGYKEVITKVLCNSDGDAFRAGQQFAKNMSSRNSNFETWVKTCREDPFVNTSSNMSSDTFSNIDTSFNNTENVFSTSNNEGTDMNLEKDSLFSKITGNPFNIVSAFKNSNLNGFPGIGTTGTSHADTAALMEINRREAFDFMRGIMDECTHLKNYSVPVDTSLTIAVCAKDDGYVPFDGVEDLRSIWPNAEVRYVEGGHVSAYVRHQKDFRMAIVDAFERYRKKYGCLLNA